MESLIIPILLVSAILNFFLGVLMVLQGYRGVFIFAIIGVAFWDISILSFYADIMKSLNWVTSAHFFALLLAISFYLFSLKFPKKIEIKINKLFIQSLPIAFFFCLAGLIIFTDLIVGFVDYEINTYFIGKYYLLYGFLLGSYLVGGSGILLQQYKNTDVILEKQQIRFILIGALVSILTSTVTDLIFPYLGLFNYIWVGPFSTITLVISVSVAILKYHLFSIKLILVELAILLLNMFLLFNVFTSHATIDFVLNISVSLFVFIFSIILMRGIYKDIRDRERIEGLAKDMEVANEKLHLLEQQKTEFVSIASHQLRTPLTVIKGYASMILEGTFGTIATPVHDAMDKLYKSSERIVALVEDLLTVSRLEQGRGALHFETADLVRVIQMVTMEMDEDIKRSNLDFSFTVEEGGEFPVAIDEKKFKQVVKHILDNAIEYTNAPGRVRIAINEDSIADKIRLTVSDTGVGMTAEQIQGIFERFNLKIKEQGEGDVEVTSGKLKVESNAEENAKGAGAIQRTDLREYPQGQTSGAGAEAETPNRRTPGIGLYIAQEIIEAHHGTLHLESVGMNEGTTVIMELPRAK